jgi:hypothetical protein
LIVFIAEEYFQQKEKSFNAWKLMDGSKTKLAGFVDPGPNPDPVEHVLAFVRSSSSIQTQNVVPFQYKSSLYFKAFRPIEPNAELLTFFGPSFSKRLGLDSKDFCLEESAEGTNGRKEKDPNPIIAQTQPKSIKDDSMQENIKIAEKQKSFEEKNTNETSKDENGSDMFLKNDEDEVLSEAETIVNEDDSDMESNSYLKRFDDFILTTTSQLAKSDQFDGMASELVKRNEFLETTECETEEEYLTNQSQQKKKVQTRKLKAILTSNNNNNKSNNKENKRKTQSFLEKVCSSEDEEIVIRRPRKKRRLTK